MFDIKNIITIFLNTTFAFLFLLFLSRMLGKKQLSQLTFFNYVTGTAIGSMGANIVNLYTFTNTDDYIALVIWCSLTLLASIISLKLPSLRALIDGQPTIVIKKGNIDKKALSNAHINIDDLTMMLRNKNVFSVKEVLYAILEPDGKLSVLKKEPEQQVTKKDINIIPQEPNILPSEIIVDGVIIEKNLKELGLSKKWLFKELKKHDINDYKKILYAEISTDKSLYINKKK